MNGFFGGDGVRWSCCCGVGADGVVVVIGVLVKRYQVLYYSSGR